MVALVSRVLVGRTPADVYVTHLYMSRGDNSLRLYQVQQLLAWIDSRSDVGAVIVCGDFNARLDAPSANLIASRFRRDSNRTDRVYAARRCGRFGLAPLLASHGQVHRLHLGSGADRHYCERGLL